eukprot:147076_1
MICIDKINEKKENYFCTVVKLSKLCIHEIIGDDVMQKVLSFIPYCGAVQCVDKTFKALSARNAVIRLNRFNTIVNDTNFETDFEKNLESVFDLNNNNNDIIEVAKQILLTKREIASRYVGNKEVYHSFEDIFANDFNKLIVFVEDGDYEFSENEAYIRTLAIIGTSNNVCIHLDSLSCDKEFRFHSENVYIENVTIKSTEDVDLILLIEGSNLWMKNTVIDQLYVGVEDVEFYAKKCRFITANNGNDTALKRWNNAHSRNFSVLGCTFDVTDNISSIIQIDGYDNRDETFEIEGNIRIIGNTFKGKFESPITILCESRNTRESVNISFSNDWTVQDNIIIEYGAYHINPNGVKVLIKRNMWW